MTEAERVEHLKRAAARRALDYVRDGMLLGLGSGTTADLFTEELGHRVQNGLRVTGVPTSRRSEAVARRVGVPLASLDEHQWLDLTVDGADEVDTRSFNLIKGGGGSLLREKLVAVASETEIIIADESKLVARLGERQPLPVEVVPFGWPRTADALARLGCQATLRLREGAPFVSDEGHYILDCRFEVMSDPARLAREIKALVGVVEHGLFIGLADRLLVASSAGVQVFEKPAPERAAMG